MTDVMGCADRLAEAGLLRPEPAASGWELRWVHPLVRAAVYSDLGATERIRLHQAAAELTDGVESIEHLVAAAVGPDEELAKRLEASARRAAAAGQTRVSAGLLLTAHQVSGSAESAADRLTLGVEQLLSLGDVGSVLPLAAALAALPETARRLSTRARVAWMTGDSASARDLAQRSWARTDPQDGRQRVLLASMLAQIEVLDGRPERAIEWADLALSTPSLSVAERSQTQAGAVLALALAGKIDAALERVEDLPDDPATVPMPRHGELRARGFAKLVGDDAAGATRDMLAVAGGMSSDPTPERIVALAGAAEAEYRTGDWASALAHANQAVSLCEDAEQTWALGFVHCMPVLVLAARGLWPEAELHLQRGEEIAAMVGDEATNSYLADARVHLDVCRDEPGAAVEHGRATLLGAPAAPREPGVLRLPVNYAAALVSLGRLDEAEGALAMFEDRATATGRESRLCALARVRGELETARRDTNAARSAFHRALELTARADTLEVALVHLAHGRFLRRRGERRAATQELDTARELLVRLEAVPWADRCDAELRLLGHHPPAAKGARPTDPLTPQERLIAELVCEGNTNQMVADRLVLSVKTIGYHLANIYTKLGIHSRTQLSAHPTMRQGSSPRD